jgi:hypothetical protein
MPTAYPVSQLLAAPQVLLQLAAKAVSFEHQDLTFFLSFMFL